MERPPSHNWTFFRVGGFDQVRIDSGADIAALGELDQKLWTALACPIKGLEFDGRTLAMIDSDDDGRIRAPEIIAAARWATANLKNPDDLLRGPLTLPLASINDSSAEGRQLLASAKEILVNLGKPDADVITLEDTADTTRIFAQTRFNGDGIVPAESAHTDADAALINDVIKCLGAAQDRSGKPGIDQPKLDQFYTALHDYAAWWAEAAGHPEALPLGNNTAAAYAAYAAIRTRVDDYFTRCRLAAFDTRATLALNRKTEEYAAIAGKTLSANGGEFAEFPLAKIEADKPLPLRSGYNPAWSAQMEALRTAVVEPLLGGDKTSLGDGEWQAIKGRFAAHETWLAKKAGAVVEPLGIVRVRELLNGDGKARIDALIAEDKALEPEMNAIVAVERLIRYHRDLYTLLNNFVNFRDFYSGRKAVFQVGTLYLDGRACELCVRADEPAKHAVLAGQSNAYLVYLDCVRRASAGKMGVVAAITNGDADHLMVGRNGVFYDRKGEDWDATVVKIIENPIGVRQAVWAPYKRLARMIGEQVEKMAAAKDKVVSSKAAAGVQSAATQAEAGKPAAPPAPFDVAKFAGIFAAIGLAIGALGTALAAVVTGFLSLAWWQIPLAILGILLLISGPSVVLAWLKLRRRNLAPILDANGWAVNARVKINILFGRSLTKLAHLPPGAQRALTDPYAQKSGGRWLWLVVLVLALAAGGYYYLHHAG